MDFELEDLVRQHEAFIKRTEPALWGVPGDDDKPGLFRQFYEQQAEKRGRSNLVHGLLMAAGFLTAINALVNLAKSTGLIR